MLVFKDVNISINRMNSTFLYNLWSWVNLYGVERPGSLVDFLTWVGCKGVLWFLLRWRVGALFPLLLPHGPCCISPVYFRFSQCSFRQFNVLCFSFIHKNK